MLKKKKKYGHISMKQKRPATSIVFFMKKLFSFCTVCVHTYTYLLMYTDIHSGGWSWHGQPSPHPPCHNSQFQGGESQEGVRRHLVLLPAAEAVFGDLRHRQQGLSKHSSGGQEEGRHLRDPLQPSGSLSGQHAWWSALPTSVMLNIRWTINYLKILQ